MDLAEVLGEQGIIKGNLVEVKLLPGVIFNTASSSLPCSIAPREIEKVPNESTSVAGYLATYDSQRNTVEISPYSEYGKGISGFLVYGDCIQSLRKIPDSD